MESLKLIGPLKPRRVHIESQDVFLTLAVSVTSCLCQSANESSELPDQCNTETERVALCM